MSKTQIIEELCSVCAELARIIAVQRNALAQHDALVAEDDIAKVHERYSALIGADEWPEKPKEEDNHG